MECVGHRTTATAGKDWLGQLEGLAHSAPAGFLCSGGCRRAASFPFVGEKDLVPSSVLKVRSQSESEGLNRCRNIMTIDQFKQKIRLFPETREEESGCESELDSSNGSISGSSTDVADAAGPDTVEQPTAMPLTKKSVRFADDCGHKLLHVKVMTEPSHCPPIISAAVLRKIRGELYEDDAAALDQSSWVIQFTQPASQYTTFRSNIAKNKVSLENLILKNDQQRMMGTIKVSNVAFEKRVFIRWSSNGWQTYMDRPANFQQSSCISDTFMFDIDIPKDDTPESRIELCVCYVAGGTEYWDNNNGHNYVLLSENRPYHPSPFHSPHFSSDRNDAYNQNHVNWGGFASWRNLSVDGPYW